MSQLTQVGTVAAVMVMVFAVAATILLSRRRHRHRTHWLGELASVRVEGEGVLIGATGDEVIDPDGRRVTGPAGEVFLEYGGGTAPLTRIGGEQHTAIGDDTTLMVEISRGSVWRLADDGLLRSSTAQPLQVHTAAGNVRADLADLLVTSEPDGWTYVICFGGTVDVANHDAVATLQPCQAARMHVGGGGVQVTTTAAGSLEGDAVVRLHRRLDRGAVTWEPCGAGSLS